MHPVAYPATHPFTHPSSLLAGHPRMMMQPAAVTAGHHHPGDGTLRQGSFSVRPIAPEQLGTSVARYDALRHDPVNAEDFVSR